MGSTSRVTLEYMGIFRSLGRHFFYGSVHLLEYMLKARRLKFLFNTVHTFMSNGTFHYIFYQSISQNGTRTSKSHSVILVRSFALAIKGKKNA
ncbi:hypothetical protein CW304_12160 [Bacillus sp. UFRGS-B20]|nr:hypothetical protein CW304_12160 [Bacillus sp. UFRGS-B20]